MLIDTIAASLFVPFCFVNSIPQKPNLKLKLSMYIVSFFINLSSFYFSHIKFLYFSAAYITIIILALLLLIATKNKVLNLLSATFGYIIAIVLNNLILFLLDVVFGLTAVKISGTTWILITFYIVYFILIYLVLSILRVYIKKLDFDALKKYKISYLILAELIICITILVFNISYGKIIGYPSETIYFNCILFVLYFILSISFIGKLIQSSKQAILIEEQKKQIQELETYTQVISESNQQTRKFKHDYLNILFTLDLLIKERKLDELETYYNEQILPTRNQLKNDEKKLLPLSNIMDHPIKSLLIAKFNSALSKKIELHFNIDEFITIPTLSPVETARILGILLDNAMDAAITAEQPEISFSCTETEHDCTIEVSNTFDSKKDISIEDLEKFGFSTKGEDRGIGLHNVTEILDNYDNISHLISIRNNIFTYTITITEG